MGSNWRERGDKIDAHFSCATALAYIILYSVNFESNWFEKNFDDITFVKMISKCILLLLVSFIISCIALFTCTDQCYCLCSVFISGRRPDGSSGCLWFHQRSVLWRYKFVGYFFGFFFFLSWWNWISRKAMGRRNTKQSRNKSFKLKRVTINRHIFLTKQNNLSVRISITQYKVR